MITFEEAKKTALKLNKRYNSYYETKNAFVFVDSNDFSFGGSNMPLAILKEDGKLMDVTSYIYKFDKADREIIKETTRL